MLSATMSLSLNLWTLPGPNIIPVDSIT